MFLSYGYMIDNIILLITGTLHQRQIAELRSKCHPLGNFDEMESVNIANTPAELYEAVLVDTPLGGELSVVCKSKFTSFLQLHISRVASPRQIWMNFT
jgi:vacuolar-type H+-ATPase subunit C/Vma6